MLLLCGELHTTNFRKYCQSNRGMCFTIQIFKYIWSESIAKNVAIGCDLDSDNNFPSLNNFLYMSTFTFHLLTLIVLHLCPFPLLMRHTPIRRRRHQPRPVRLPRLHRPLHLIIHLQNHPLRPVLPKRFLVLALHNRERLHNIIHIVAPRWYLFFFLYSLQIFLSSPSMASKAMSGTAIVLAQCPFHDSVGE